MAVTDVMREKYTWLVKRMLPSGFAWAKQVGSNLSKLCGAIAEEFARVESRAIDLLAEFNPYTTTELIEEWEEFLDLPDDCTEETTLTLAERRSQVVSKLAAQGGANAAYFEQLSARLGYDVTVSNYPSSYCGHTVCGSPIRNINWKFWFHVSAPATPVTQALCGSAQCGDPLSVFGSPVLVCQINKLKPAHTNAYYTYGE